MARFFFAREKKRKKRRDIICKRMRNRELYIRLQSCLQTILDMEEYLERCNLLDSLRKELGMLRGFMDSIPEMELAEQDVERIEAATANFLGNLSLPLQTQPGNPGICKRVQ